MSDDLVRRLLSASIYKPHEAERLCEEAADRIEALEEALREVKELSDRRSTHPMSSESDYFRIARAALEGKDG